MAGDAVVTASATAAVSAALPMDPAKTPSPTCPSCERHFYGREEWGRSPEGFDTRKILLPRLLRALRHPCAPRRLYSPHCSIGVHLIRGNPPPRPSKIDPKADHISFEVS
eukprot:359660-Chlamydomonas_euryale.AAC.7